MDDIREEFGQLENPFTFRAPISEPDRFFGRQREVDQVFSRLLNRENESSSLVGNRRIGKTSLLEYLTHENVRCEHGLDLDRFNFVFVDLQELGQNTTPAEFWSHLFEEMALQCKDSKVRERLCELDSPDTINNFVIVGIFKLIDKRDQHIVLLLDEFDLVTTNVNFDEDFFSFLRSMATQHNLSLITSSHQALINLTHSETIRSSPFFNIFANINLGLFSEEEVLDFFTSSLNESGKQFTKSDVNNVLHIAGPYPFFLQTACYFLFEAYKKDLDAGERLRFIKENFATEAESHFRYFWTKSDAGEQIVLIILALTANQSPSGGQPCRRIELEGLYPLAVDTVNRLEKRALVTEELSEYTLFSSVFGEWIVKELAVSAEIGFGYKSILNFASQFLKRVRMKNWRAVFLNPPVVGEMYQDLVNSWINNSRNPDKVVDLLKNETS